MPTYFLFEILIRISRDLSVGLLLNFSSTSILTTDLVTKVKQKQVSDYKDTASVHEEIIKMC